MADQIQVPESKPMSVCAIIGTVLGAMGVVLSWIPIINNVAAILGFVGAVLAIVGIVGTRAQGKKHGRVLAIVGLVLSIIAIAATLIMQKATSDAIDKATQQAQDQIAQASGDKTEELKDQFPMTDVTVAADQFTYKISGTITNKSGKDVSYVSLTFALKDESGAKIADAYANTSTLKKDGTWKFEASGLPKDPSKVASYELTEISVM